jgi:hypothetical protein
VHYAKRANRIQMSVLAPLNPVFSFMRSRLVSGFQMAHCRGIDQVTARLEMTVTVILDARSGSRRAAAHFNSCPAATRRSSGAARIRMM